MKHPSSLLLLLFLSACIGSKTAKKHRFPTPVDTRSKVVQYQEKKTYSIGDVHASNEFPAARLNDFSQLNDSTFQATISPENTPINPSPWYAFKLWTDSPQTLYLKLHYSSYKHRYHPKLSHDGEQWSLLDSSKLAFTADSMHVILQLQVGNSPLWVAAQELQDHRRVGEWATEMSKHAAVSVGEAGKSVQGRSIHFLDIHQGEARRKPTVVIISRQHPPEVTGYFAMKAFVETIVAQGSKNGFLDRFRVMVYPLMNPDGVDLGHYRHNTGGVDMNRDWSLYHQPEVRQVANHIVRESKTQKNNVILGLDFHSTYYDVYYTNDESLVSKIPGFTKDWLTRIQEALELDDINEKPSKLGSPVSKGWFYQQFKAAGITYEIGDDTPRDFIQVKGEISAKAMMNILMERSEEWGL
ncbi:MAG: M14 family metallopeptidase [Bacteroidota bacterium]